MSFARAGASKVKKTVRVMSPASVPSVPSGSTAPVPKSTAQDAAVDDDANKENEVSCLSSPRESARTLCRGLFPCLSHQPPRR